jgi:hypothetical protein
MKRFKLTYVQHSPRFILAWTMLQALEYATTKNIRRDSYSGDPIPWGTIDKIELWDDVVEIVRPGDEPYAVGEETKLRTYEEVLTTDTMGWCSGKFNLPADPYEKTYPLTSEEEGA